MLTRTGLLACLVLFLAAGCGGAAPRHAAAPKLPRALAQHWATEADSVAAALHANDCGAAQQIAQSLAADVDASANRIPARLRSTTETAAATLADRISCKSKPPKKGPKPPKKPKDHGHGPGKGGEGDGG